MLYDIIASVKNKRILNRKKHIYEKNLLNDSRAVRKYNMEVAVLKKLVTVLGAFFAVLLACPLSVFAAEGSKAPSTVPVWLCIPFAGLLLCIAVMPLVKAEWWESHQPLVVALWIILMVVPFAFVYGAGKTAETVLDCIVNDYLTFIILLFGLFCVSGNITMEGDFAGSPRVNVGLLALGTLLASCIGTTGASMLMVRPVIKMNSWRKRKGHIMIFFIFMISNMGGCLTPIGDPPLLMGFMRVRKKLKHLIVNVSNLKTVFPDIRIRIGQGNTHSSYMGITDSFREAELAIMNRMGENEDTYICYSEDSKSGKTKEEIFDSGLRNEILTYQERMDIEGTLRLVDKVGEKLKPFKYDGKLVYEVFGELVETLRFGMKYSREGRNLFLIEDYKKQYRRIWDYDELFQWIKSDLSRVHQVYMKNIQDEESKPIRDAKKYIHDNFNKHISLENVSEYIGFNAAYFSTLFKKETGKNFLEYVTELRIQNAKNYLIQTNYDIAEVASAVGYNDLKYFSKLFKKTTGLNPSEFRKLYS